MFRECFFKYAGVSSEEYNLRLVYISNNNEDFQSGGEYTPKTDFIPKAPEQLLYGLDYSDKPLEFDIEIINIEKAIPQHQVIEIKDWLFGQDGWKPFYVLDERQDYYLKCLLIPKEDIVDGLGIRGFRCTLRNISGFWYGKDIKHTITQEQLNSNKQTTQYVAGDETAGEMYWSCFEIDVSQDSIANQQYVLPIIKVTTSDANDYISNDENIFEVGVTNYTSKEELISSYTIKQAEGRSAYNSSQKGIYPDSRRGDVTSAIYISLSDVAANSVFELDSKYMEFELQSNPDLNKVVSIGKRSFNLSYGKNVCYVLNPENIANIEIAYTPRYRIGAF